MKLLIDADGCPVVDSTVNLARKYHLSCLIFCDCAHLLERPGAQTITLPQGPDSADFALLNNVRPHDIVVTQDYGLAALCLAKKARPLNQNGREYTSDNIDSLLMSRHTARKIRRSGGRLKGPARRTADQDISFAQALETLIRQQLLL